MRRLFALSVLGLLLAGPAAAQEPCSLGVHLPLVFYVEQPICPNQPLDLVVKACGPCVRGLGWIHEPGGPIHILATMTIDSCLGTCRPDSLSIPIGTFVAGRHLLLAQVQATVLGPDTSKCTLRRHEFLEFDVPRVCGAPPLPYVDRIQVGTSPDSICPGLPIPFAVSGHLPDDCHAFRGLEFLPSPVAGPLPQPPIAVLRVARGADTCETRPCLPTSEPWHAAALLPALPPGSYLMWVEVQEESWCDSGNVIGRHFAQIPFTVAPSCSLPPPTACYVAGFRAVSQTDPQCNVLVAPGTPGRAIVDVSGPTLAGLEGRFMPTSEAFRITGMSLGGPGSVGMRLLWRPHEDAATFVAYRESEQICAAVDCPWSIEVVLEVLPGVPVPDRSALLLGPLLASDWQGRELPLCGRRQALGTGVCLGPSCDFNRDGRTDVRDLVLMANCVRTPGSCPANPLDCDRDGSFDLDDVLCCARVVLYGRMPDSAAARSAPELGVAVGTPRVTSSGVDVPVRIRRADLFGAARLAFSYPADRFDGATVEVMGEASRWLELSETAHGEMVVGLIATAPDAEAASDLDLVLHFALTAGQQASTAIGLASSEFAGHDGVRLTPGSGTTSMDPRVELALSPAHPNPFALETRFVLSLTRGADVDLGVFDLGGRRVATLHRGALVAGEHTFAWDGTASDGRRARAGVYFHRAVAAGATATRKLVLLGGP